MSRFASVTVKTDNEVRITARTTVYNDSWVLYTQALVDPGDAAVNARIYMLNHKGEDNFNVSVTDTVAQINTAFVAAANTRDMCPFDVLDYYAGTALYTRWFNKAWIQFAIQHPSEATDSLITYMTPDMTKPDSVRVDGNLAATLVLLNS